MQLTFIEAASGIPLVKKFTASETLPYPNVAAINSHDFSVTADAQGLKDFYDLLHQPCDRFLLRIIVKGRVR